MFSDRVDQPLQLAVEVELEAQRVVELWPELVHARPERVGYAQDLLALVALTIVAGDLVALGDLDPGHVLARPELR